MASESLDKLNVDFKEYRSLIEILDKKGQLVEVKAVILAAAFSIFQGNLYAQLNFPSASSRRPDWIPVCLSTLVSFAFWLVFVPTVNSCVQLKMQKESTFMEQERVYRKIFSIRTGRSRDDGGGAARQTLAKSFAFARCQRYVYVGALHLAFLFFTMLVTYELLPISQRIAALLK